MVQSTSLCALFCGTAAGTKSAERGAYYAGPGNRFRDVLHNVQLTSHKLTPDEFSTLPPFGLGLTDVAKGASGPDAKIERPEYDAHTFKTKIRHLRPGFVAFNGKNAACAFYCLPTAQLEYGRGTPVPDFPQVFILPSTSGAARRYWNEEWWQEFARLLGPK